METIYTQIERHLQNSESIISLQAAASIIPTCVAKASGYLSEVTAEGYPGARYHSGADVVDLVEQVAVDKAQALFGAKYANVQPLSCSIANVITMDALLETGGKILSLRLKDGGHLSHGAAPSQANRRFRVSRYSLLDERIDYGQVRELALEFRPNLIVAGASSYPRKINYRIFREIADEVGALLLADISHVAGLVATKLLDSPVDHAHVTTTSVYKQLFGPKGGLILSGRDHDYRLKSGKTLKEALNLAVFPGLQGTPDFAQIAMKAVAFENASTEKFESIMRNVMGLARCMGRQFQERKLRLVTGGTDTHMLLLDLTDRGLSGRVVEEYLESVGILTNRNLIPGDQRVASETSGIRLGTNIIGYRGVTEDEAKDLANLICDAIESLAENRVPSPDLGLFVKQLVVVRPLVR